MSVAIVDGTSEKAPEPHAKETASQGSQAKHDGAGQPCPRKLEPHIYAAQNHEDQTGGDYVHGISPEVSEGPIAAIARVIGNIAGEGVEDFHNAPEIDIGLAHSGAALGPIG